MASIDIDRINREEARWRILRVLDAGRPYAVGEAVIYRALHDVSLPCTPRDLRRDLSYLRDCELIEVSGEDGPEWSARLTAAGVDVVEYTAPAPPGIARPARYW